MPELDNREQTVLDLFDEHGEPTVSTYNAFAGSLIEEHGLRLGIETDLTVTSDATRFQRASRVIRRFREPLPHLTGKLPSTIEKVLALDGALSEHLVTPERLREHDLGVAAAVDALAKPVKPLLRAIATDDVDLHPCLSPWAAWGAVQRDFFVSFLVLMVLAVFGAVGFRVHQLKTGAGGTVVSGLEKSF